MYFFPPSTSLVSVFLQTIVQNRFAPISHCTSTCVFQSSPPNMENTTPYYDDADGPFVTPCSRYSDNNVGAKLSILYYFMFLISLFGNGLVLIIIYRWVVTESEARIKPTWCCIKKKNFFFFFPLYCYHLGNLNALNMSTFLIFTAGHYNCCVICN